MLNNEYWEDRYRAEEKARELADKRVAYQLLNNEQIGLIWSTLSLKLSS